MGGLFLYKVAKLVTIYPGWSINPWWIVRRREEIARNKIFLEGIVPRLRQINNEAINYRH